MGDVATWTTSLMDEAAIGSGKNLVAVVVVAVVVAAVACCAVLVGEETCPQWIAR